MKIEMQKLAEGDEGEWSKAFPVLNADVRKVLEWKLGISKNDSEDIAVEAIVKAIDHFPWDSEEKTFIDFRYFTICVAKGKGIDLKRHNMAEKRGAGGVLNLYDEIGKKGKTRIDFLFANSNVRALIEEAELIKAIFNCKNEVLNESEKNFFLHFHFFGESYGEISEKFGKPIGSIGVTLKRASEKIKECLKKKGFEKPNK